MKNSFTDSFTIQQYLAGNLDSKAMHELEKRALEDEFLAEALDGYNYIHHPQYNKHLSLLQQQLHDRIATHQVQKTSVAHTAQRLSIAATAAVIFVLACTLFWLNATKTLKSEASYKEVQVTLGEAQGTKVRASSTQASPAIGWGPYNEYLQKNLKHGTADGPVQIEFTLSNGRPVNISVMKGNAALTTEIIRLLEEGPLWQAESAKGRIQLTLAFEH